MTPEKSPAWDVQRLAALSDGIFAVAMTLLAYNVHVPSGPLSERQRGAELGRMLAQELWISAFGAPLVSRFVNALRAKRARRGPA